MSQRKVKVVRVDGPIDPGKPGKVQFRNVMKDGKRVRVRVIDSNSPDFAAQFLSSFRSSVRKARKENRALVETV